LIFATDFGACFPGRSAGATATEVTSSTIDPAPFEAAFTSSIERRRQRYPD